MARGQKKYSSTSTSADDQAAWPAQAAVSNHVEEPEYHDAASDHAEGDLIEEIQPAAAPEQEKQGEPQEIELPKAVPASASADAKKGTFIGGQLEHVPFVGQYVAPLLLNRFVLPITQKADPFVEAGVKRATPYVENLVERVQEVPDVMQTVPRRLYQTVREAPGCVYRQSVNCPTGTRLALPAKMQALPAHAYEITTLTAASMVARVKETSTKMSKRATEVSAEVVKTIKAAPTRVTDSAKQALVNIKAAPAQMFQWAQGFVRNALDNIKAAPGQLYATLMNRKTHLVESIETARSKAIGVSTSAAKSVATTVQPYVHRVFRVLAPRAESVATNRRVQSVYQHPFIQGSIEKATPYVSKVTKQPTILEIARQVSAWALPAM